MVLGRNGYESAAVSPTGTDWNVKAKESTLFDYINVATSVVIKNRSGSGDLITACFNEAGVKPLVLEPGESFALEGYPVTNIFITPGASFGVSDKVDIVITAE